jgi:hypothetical protein
MGGEWNIAAPGDKYRVASLQSNIERARAGTVEANARLIAAAPETAAERDRLKKINAELLAALKAILANEVPSDAEWKAAEAAVREAEGV